MENKVSIIIPCFNQAKFIPETLDSVLAQTYQNWECIIIDDGSYDNSREIVQDYIDKDSRFSYIYQENQGPAAARNNGIQHSYGDFILPLDADDLIADTYIEKAISVFVSNPDFKIVYCKAKKFGACNQIWDLPDYSYEKFIWENMIFCSSIFKRKDYDKTNGYNSNMRDGLEDWDFWLSLLNPSDKVYRIDEILFFYRIKNTSRNTHAEEIEHELLQKMYMNHKEKYEPYMKDFINIKRHRDLAQRQYSTLKKHEQDILNSKEYRLGLFLLKPLRAIREKIRSI